MIWDRSLIINPPLSSVTCPSPAPLPTPPSPDPEGVAVKVRSLLVTQDTERLLFTQRILSWTECLCPQNLGTLTASVMVSGGGPAGGDWVTGGVLVSGLVPL